MGDRIYVADAQESVFFMKYKKAENQLYIYADDTSSRYLTTQLQLDYDTLCGADKFGNVFMMRLPSDLSQQVCHTSCWWLLYNAIACQQVCCCSFQRVCTTVEQQCRAMLDGMLDRWPSQNLIKNVGRH